MSSRVYVSFYNKNNQIIQSSEAVEGRNSEVFAFDSGGVHKTIDKSTGKTTGNRQFEPIFLTKAVCQATPIIFKCITTNEKLGKVDVNYYKADENTGKEKLFFKVTLENVQVVSQKLRVPDTSVIPEGHLSTLEDIKMTAEKITQVHLDPHIEHSDEYSKKDN